MSDTLDTAQVRPETAQPQTEVEVEQTEEEGQPSQDQAQDHGEKPESNAADDVVFPKKAVNAISRRDKQIARLKAENKMLQEFRQQLASQQQTLNSATKDQGAPREENFDTYGEFLKAQILHELQAQKQPEQKNQPTPEQLQHQAWYQEREAVVQQKSAEYAKSAPDYSQLIEEYADVLDSASPEIERLFLELDDSPAAFYAMAKDGTLESVARMSPQMAAYHLAQAEQRGKELLQQKKTSGAPRPIQGVKGAGKSTKDLSSLDPKDLLKRLGVKH